MMSLHRHKFRSWNGDISSCPLKLMDIQEEFMVLTHDVLKAIIQNQLFYWTQRVKAFDLLFEEEKCF